MATKIVSSAIVLEVLRNDNYANWRVCVKNYLLAQDLWDIIDKPKPTTESEVDGKAWRKKNAAALHAIQISCGPDTLSQIREINSAKKAWDKLEEMSCRPPTTVFGVLSRSEDFEENDMAGNKNNKFSQYLPLYNAVGKGDWDAVKKFLDDHQDASKAIISENGETTLHVASFARHVKIVKELVNLMSEEDLEIQDLFGETALSIAAFNGSTKIAKCLHEKNENLAKIVNYRNEIPLIRASSTAHKDVTCFLYSVTPVELLSPDAHGPMFLNNIIAGKMFDVALDLLRRCPPLATATTKSGLLGLNTLSCMPHAFPSSITKLPFRQKCIYYCIQVHPPADSCRIRQNGQTERENSTLEGIQVNSPTSSADDLQSIFQIRQSGSENCMLEAVKILSRQCLRQLRGLVSNLLKFVGYKKIYDLKLNHLQAKNLLRRLCEEVSRLDASQLYVCNIENAIFKAVENGVIECIVEIIKAKPDLIWVTDSNDRDIFTSAIEYRQEKIFSLIYMFGARNDSKNNMLHLASKLPGFPHLPRASGAALQMQIELLWFKEVESIMSPVSREDTNIDNETPRQAFTRNHKELVKEGEKWMKETATSCTVVGALIITIMFAIAFTIPGGNNQTSGYPIFLQKKLFMIFLISDAISLFSSSTSVLMFLGILTSRYAQDDFRKSLPKKLMFGLSTLFFSIAAMMVAFCAFLLIILKGQLQIAIPIVLLAGVPVTFFILFQFHLVVEILHSTFFDIFDKKMNPWLLP